MLYSRKRRIEAAAMNQSGVVYLEKSVSDSLQRSRQHTEVRNLLPFLSRILLNLKSDLWWKTICNYIQSNLIFGLLLVLNGILSMKGRVSVRIHAKYTEELFNWLIPGGLGYRFPCESASTGFNSSDFDDSDLFLFLLLHVLCEVARLFRLTSEPHFLLDCKLSLFIASICTNQSSAGGFLVVSVREGMVGYRKHTTNIHRTWRLQIGITHWDTDSIQMVCWQGAISSNTNCD